MLVRHTHLIDIFHAYTHLTTTQTHIQNPLGVHLKRTLMTKTPPEMPVPNETFALLLA